MLQKAELATSDDNILELAIVDQAARRESVSRVSFPTTERPAYIFFSLSSWKYLNRSLTSVFVLHCYSLKKQLCSYGDVTLQWPVGM